GVAYRTARKAQAEFARRQKHEARGRQRSVVEAADDRTWGEVRQGVHEEVNRLPDPLPRPPGLCDLEGEKQNQTAARPGLPKGTLKGRLERGRELLRGRLVRRGLGPAALLVVAAWPGAVVSAMLPTALADSTVKGSMEFAAGHVAPLVLSPR